jgi:hypothetical protein
MAVPFPARSAGHTVRITGRRRVAAARFRAASPAILRCSRSRKEVEMFRRLRTIAVTALVTAGVGVAGVVAAPSASADTRICGAYGTTTIQSGRYIVQNNRWGSGSTQCINVTGTGFSVVQADGSNATNGAPKSYPSVYYGCHWGNCSTGTILPLAASSSAFSSITTSVSMSYPSAGTWDAAYDIWFDPTARTNGQPTGAEVMVWLNHQGTIQPVGSKVATVTLNGAGWDVWEGNIGWNVVSYVRQSGTSSMNFSISSFFNDVVSRGYGSRSWYLTSIQAGFEPWINGVGLAVNSFSVTTPGASNPACSATFSVTNPWSGGFQGNVTVRNSGSTPINGWTVKWTFPGSQTVTQAWNTTLTQSGAAVTATSLSYNGQLAAGASTSFGFSGSGTAPASLSMTCTP